MTGSALPADAVARKGLARYLLREGMSLLTVAALLFASAGTLAWWGAWAMLAVTGAWIAGMTIIVQRRSPGLFAERLEVRPGARRWDVAYTSLHGLLQLATFIVAGLDRRFGWTVGLPVAAQGLALGACVAGSAFFLWAVACNPFFSQIVRIQAERGHTVATQGPYRFLRHPGYLGGVSTQIGIPVLLGSWPALAVGVVDTLALIVRTAVEDRTLQADLPGYAEYARRVRYRLVPGVW
jgi:protein-S-isoprenylcysteine O-methyltransferase Ste14